MEGKQMSHYNFGFIEGSTVDQSSEIVYHEAILLKNLHLVLLRKRKIEGRWRKLS